MNFDCGNVGSETRSLMFASLLFFEPCVTSWSVGLGHQNSKEAPICIWQQDVPFVGPEAFQCFRNFASFSCGRQYYGACSFVIS